MEDSRIVEMFWNRDQNAIAKTAEKYGGYCSMIANNILGSREDAEECVNDTFLNAWNAMPPHRPAMLSTFLGRITRNLSLNRFRRNHAEKRGGGEAAVVLDELAECVSGKDSVEEEMDRRELVKTIDTFLSTLPPEKRSIFICRYWYFDCAADIASRFGMTENYANVTLHRLREKLRRYLQERGYEL